VTSIACSCLNKKIGVELGVIFARSRSIAPAPHRDRETKFAVAQEQYRLPAPMGNKLLSNCTSNIRFHAEHIGSAYPWDWQLLVNGFIEI